jgi:hypothetical protein
LQPVLLPAEEPLKLERKLEVGDVFDVGTADFFFERPKNDMASR